MTHATITRLRIAIILIAPAVVLLGHWSHPWIGDPGDTEFFNRLAEAVAADPVRWAVSHLGVAVGSGLLILAFMAVRGYLRDYGEERWSAFGLPFIVLGSVLHALLPAMEFAPLAAHNAGADAAAVQEALMPWFVPILVTAAALFAVGVFGFVGGILASRALGPVSGWLVVGALVVMAITRFMPVGMAQLHVGPAAAVLALWPIAYVMWKRAGAKYSGPSSKVALRGQVSPST